MQLLWRDCGACNRSQSKRNSRLAGLRTTSLALRRRARHHQPLTAVLRPPEQLQCRERIHRKRSPSRAWVPRHRLPRRCCRRRRCTRSWTPAPSALDSRVATAPGYAPAGVGGATAQRGVVRGNQSPLAGAGARPSPSAHGVGGAAMRMHVQQPDMATMTPPAPLAGGCAMGGMGAVFSSLQGACCGTPQQQSKRLAVSAATRRLSAPTDAATVGTSPHQQMPLPMPPPISNMSFSPAALDPPGVVYWRVYTR